MMELILKNQLLYAQEYMKALLNINIQSINNLRNCNQCKVIPPTMGVHPLTNIFLIHKDNSLTRPLSSSLNTNTRA